MDRRRALAGSLDIDSARIRVCRLDDQPDSTEAGIFDRPKSPMDTVVMDRAVGHHRTHQHRHCRTAWSGAAGAGSLLDRVLGRDGAVCNDATEVCLGAGFMGDCFDHSWQQLFWKLVG